MSLLNIFFLPIALSSQRGLKNEKNYLLVYAINLPQLIHKEDPSPKRFLRALNSFFSRKIKAQRHLAPTKP